MVNREHPRETAARRVRVEKLIRAIDGAASASMDPITDAARLLVIVEEFGEGTWRGLSSICEFDRPASEKTRALVIQAYRERAARPSAKTDLDWIDDYGMGP